MSDRTRKKWLKKHGKYVNPRETWDLCESIAEYTLPRLKRFRKENNAYPGFGDVNTPEKWDNILDKMIVAFQYIVDADEWWIGNKKYDYTDGLYTERKIDETTGNYKTTICEEDWVAEVRKRHDKEERRRDKVIEEGLELFAKYFRHLWW